MNKYFPALGLIVSSFAFSGCASLEERMVSCGSEAVRPALVNMMGQVSKNSITVKEIRSVEADGLGRSCVADIAWIVKGKSGSGGSQTLLFAVSNHEEAKNFEIRILDSDYKG